MKSLPIKAVREQLGIVERVLPNEKFSCELTLCEWLDQTYKNGTCGVLVPTNEQAVKIQCDLEKRKYNTVLVQTNEGLFLLEDLYEMDCFLEYVGRGKEISISREKWQRAEERLKQEFKHSKNLGIALKCVGNYDEKNQDLYYDDFMEYLKESKLDDFIEVVEGKIMISTIHKAKGREFDSVYMIPLMDSQKQLPEAINAKDKIINELDRKRVNYVGITRAKHNLYMFYGKKTKYEIRLRDIRLFFNHKGVNLGLFESKQGLYKLMVAGSVWENGDCLSMLSQAGKKKLNEYLEKGYQIRECRVKFQVMWFNEKVRRDVLILLPEIRLCK